MNDNAKGAGDNNGTAGEAAWAAFQKVWSDTFLKMMQAGFTFSPESLPPEVARQIRSGIFQALAQSWDQFLRSPQCLEGTRQWMDSAMAFGKLTNEFLSRARHETQATSRDDIDSIMLAVRQMETRVLERVQDMAAQVDALNRRLDGLSGRAGAPAGTRRKGDGKRRAP